MNRKNLTSAVLAGLAGAAGIAASAQAVNLNPDGLGQVLIYPYYTTRAGNDTLLSVVNTTENAKAVKVRFLEGQNTREVLDFNLYLSPFDVWTAALIDGGVVDENCVLALDGENGTQRVLYDGEPLEGPEGGQCGVPHLLTVDTTCTVPYLRLSASTAPGLQAFLPFRFTDGGPTEITRASEGHFEMIEMGTLTDAQQGSATAATHDDTGVPANCGQLVDAWTRGGTGEPDGYWLDTNGGQNPTPELTDIEAPSGGLFGGAAVINVSNGFMFSYDAKAINGFASVEDPGVFDENGNQVPTPLHQEPGDVDPGLNSGDGFEATVFLDDGSTLVYDFEATPLDAFTQPRSVDAVSYVFMHDQLINEYNIDPDIGGETEWVVTFPTKHFYVFEEDAGLPLPKPPFTEFWDETQGGDACEVVLLEGVYDREENSPQDPTTPGRPPIVSPAPPTPPGDPIIPFELCFETNVIRFAAPEEDDMMGEGGEETDVLGALNATTFELPEGYLSGWVRLELDDYPHDQNADGVIDDVEEALSRNPLGDLEGLPVTGFAVQKFGNLNAQVGIAAFYGGIYQHKGTRKASS